MGFNSRKGDRNWDCYEEEIELGNCGCNLGKIVEVYEVASHEKVPRIERDYIGRRVICSNSLCPSKLKYK